MHKRHSDGPGPYQAQPVVSKAEKMKRIHKKAHSKRRSSRTAEIVTGVLGVVKRTPFTEELRADPVAPFPGRFPRRATSEAPIASRER